MLRDIFIYQFYNRIFSLTTSRKREEEHLYAFNKIWKEMTKTTAECKIGSISVVKLQYHYAYDPGTHVIVFFTTDLTDRANYVQKYLVMFLEAFLEKNAEMLKELIIIDGTCEKSVKFTDLEPLVDKMFEKLRPKVSIVGYSGVGKTTILHLIRDVEIPTEHIPTITGDKGRVKIGKFNFDFWDFAGQDEFKMLWSKFIKGSDAVLIITDSTPENCERSKEFIEIIKDHEPNARYCVIGNKQDLQDSISITQIEKIMGVKAYAMVANNPENRTKMINIIADLLEIDIEGLEVLSTLKLKDQYFSNALAAIHAGDMVTAALFFEKLIPVLTEMGDNALASEIAATLQQIKNSSQNQSQLSSLNQNSSGTPAAQIQLMLAPNSTNEIQMLQSVISDLKQGFSVADEKLSLIEFKLSLGRYIQNSDVSEIMKEIKYHSEKILQYLFQLN